MNERKEKVLKNRCICFGILLINLSMMGCSSSKFEKETVNSNLKQTQAITESSNDRQVTAGVSEDNEIETQTIEKETQMESGIMESTEEPVVVIEITISEDKYIYENHSIELDALVKEITTIEGKVIINITDENATQKAYQELINELDKIHIEYSEK